MKMDFSCPACGAHVEIQVQGFVAHIEDDVQAVCRGERGQHKVTRMERIATLDSTTATKPKAL